jgi:UDP:flavonoid glycosyltransferase YjiC (YdhE family)
MLALGAALVARGHTVGFETWERWREFVEAAGMAFIPAPEHKVFPTVGEPLAPYEAVAHAVAITRPAVAAFGPAVVVHDVLTLAPALSAELEGIPTATLIPHVHPAPAPDAPPYSLGARLPSRGVGRRLWRAVSGPAAGGLRRGERELDDVRRRLGLPPSGRLFGGLSERLVIVGSFPQLEYPRDWRPHEHVVGPLLWEPPAADVGLPPGDAPLVVVAPSTAQDPGHRLLRAALAGLGSLPVRVLATWNRRPLDRPVHVPANTRLVEWISYSRTMPPADIVVSHGGAGTLARSLAAGCVPVVVPAAGDQNENAARVDWAGVGIRLPWRFLSPATLRWTVARALAEPGLRDRASALGRWAAEHDGTERAADLVEELAGVSPRSTAARAGTR